MDEFTRKYGGYGEKNFSVGEDWNRSSALGAFRALLKGNDHNGDLFRMYTDEFMREYLLPEDFAYWLECKAAAIS